MYMKDKYGNIIIYLCNKANIMKADTAGEQETLINKNDFEID